MFVRVCSVKKNRHSDVGNDPQHEKNSPFDPEPYTCIDIYGMLQRLAVVWRIWVTGVETEFVCVIFR